jgi:hypothetical protein
MSAYDIGALIIAVRAALPTSRLADFQETLYRAATGPMASDDLRIACGLEPRDDEPPSKRKFDVIAGGAA